MPKPPKEVRDAAKRAIAEREKYKGLKNKPLTPTGVARMNQLASGKEVSVDTIKRMKSFLERHDKNFKPSERVNGRQTKGTIAYNAWGGRAGLRWAKKVLRETED